jgi:hypothetical protein
MRMLGPFTVWALLAACFAAWAEGGAPGARQDGPGQGAGAFVGLQRPTDGQIGVQADHVSRRAGGTVVEGSVRAAVGDLTLQADAAMVDADLAVARFVGRVSIGSAQVKTVASSLEVHVDTGKWRVTDALTVIEPDYFGGTVASPIYVNAREVWTPQGRDVIEAGGAQATSCDRDHPHYDLRSSQVRVLPSGKVKLRKPSLYVLGRRVFRYPFDLTLSTNSRSNRIVPEIGQSEAEGYYAKFGYLYTMGDANSGLLRLNLTQKRGTGIGFDHELQTPRQTAEVSLFVEPAEGAVTSRAQHRLQLSDTMNWDLNASLQRNSGYYGSTQTLSSNWTVTNTTPEATSQLGLQRSLSEAGSNTSRRFSAAFSHRQNPSPDFGWNVRSSYQDVRYTAGQPGDQELETSAEFHGRSSLFDWRLLADRRYDVDGSRYTGDQNYRTLNRVPELVLNTDGRRMPALRVLGGQDVRLGVELGRFRQSPDDLSVSRAAARLEVGGRERRLTGSSRFQTSARYYQAVYDDGSAKYMLGATSQLTAGIGGGWETRMQMSYGRPAGYAPIRLDYWGRQESMQLQAVRLRPNRSRIELSTGFDFVSDQWNAVVGRAEWMTSRSSKLQLQGGYDVEQATWRPLNATWEFVHPRRLLISLGSQYDLDQSKLRQVNANLDWLVTRRTRLEALGAYSGYTHSVDNLDLRVTRDMHCWLGSASWSKLTGEFQINLGLKAFPSVQTNFGMQRGYRSSTGTGAYD